MINDATGETRFDQSVYDAIVGQQSREQADAAALRGVPSTSSSSNVSQSIMDPNAIALQQEEMRLRQRELDARMANDRVQGQYARDKLALDQRIGNAANIRADQALLEQIGARQAQNELSRASLMQDSANLQASMDFQASQANARAQADAAQINESRRQANLEQRRGVARDIADFSKQPGDIGALASYQLAGDTFGKAIAQGQDFRTPESTAPLDLLLGTQAELGKGPNLFQPSMISAPRVPTPDFSRMNAPAVGVPAAVPPRPAVPGMPVAPQGAPAAAPDQGGFVDPGSDQYVNDAWYAPGAERQALFTQDKEPGGSYGIQEALELLQREANEAAGKSGGGMTTDRMFKGNERGPELFMNPTGAPIVVIDASTTKKLTSGKKVKGHAAGTLRIPGGFDTPPLAAELFQRPGNSPQALFPGQIPPREDLVTAQSSPSAGPRQWFGASYSGLSAQPQTNAPSSILPAQYSQSAAETPGTQSNPLAFLNAAYQRAAARTPWARNAPTPVGVSAPGTSGFTQQVAASLAALRYGVHPSLFLEEAMRMAPVGLSGAPTRRTR